MWDDARRTTGSDDDLFRQAYLLTGDPERAERLARHALGAAAQHSRRTGPAGSDDAALGELVRAFVDEAGPGGHAGQPLPPGRHAAAWTALGGLPARRRAVLVLRYAERLSDRQIADRLGSTPRIVQADAEAGLLTLSPMLTGAGEPGRLVAAALADAGRRCADLRRRTAGPPAVGRWNPPVPVSVPPAGDGDGHDWWTTGVPLAAGSAAAGAGYASMQLPSRRPGASGHGNPRPAAGHGPAGQDPAGQDFVGQDPAGRDFADQDPAGRDFADQDFAGQDPAGHDFADQDFADQDYSGRETAGRDPAGQDHAGREPAGGGYDQGERGSGGYDPSGRGSGGWEPSEWELAGQRAVVGRPDDADEPPFAAAAFPLDAPPPRHRFRAPAMIGAAVLTALVLGAAAILVPAALGGDDPQAPEAGAAAETSQAAAAVAAVPTRSVPKGLLDWPARGSLGEDQQALTAAVAAWKAKVPAEEAPTSAVGMLYAGELDGRQVALVQALDKNGTPRVAQLSGFRSTAYRLVHAEPLTGRAELLSFMPPDGRGGRLRVLVSPEGQAADGLLASDVSKVPLRKVKLSPDGVSDVLPSPPGIPTCSRVVLMGLPAPLGRSGPRVLESGVVIADMLGAMTMEVEVASSTLAAGDDAVPQTAWFLDGAALAKKARLPKTTKATVAALGPRLRGQALSDGDKRIVESRAYELRAGGRKYVGAIVTFGGRTVCTTVSQVAPGQEGRLTAFALRCPLPSGTAGLVHVVGGADVKSVQVNLDPTPDPPGQAPYGSFLTRPESGATSGFAVLDVVPAGFPCGAGTVQATGIAETSQPIRLPVFTP